MSKITFKVDPNRPEIARAIFANLKVDKRYEPSFITSQAGFLYSEDGKYTGWDRPCEEGVSHPSSAVGTLLIDATTAVDLDMVTLVDPEVHIYSTEGYVIPRAVFEEHVQPHLTRV